MIQTWSTPTTARHSGGTMRGQTRSHSHTHCGGRVDLTQQLNQAKTPDAELSCVGAEPDGTSSVDSRPTRDPRWQAPPFRRGSTTHLRRRPATSRRSVLPRHPSATRCNRSRSGTAERANRGPQEESDRSARPSAAALDAGLATCRGATLKHTKLPAGENFQLESGHGPALGRLQLVQGRLPESHSGQRRAADLRRLDR